MAFVLGAAEAASLLEASTYAAIGFESSTSPSWIPAVGAGIAGAFGLGSIFAGASSHHGSSAPRAGRPFNPHVSVPSGNSNSGGPGQYRLRGMPRGRTYRRRRTGRRKYKKRRRTTALNTRVGGFLGIEKKFQDYQVDSSIVGTVASSVNDPTSSVNCLNAVAQGDGQSSRDGKEIRMLSLDIRGTVLFSGTRTRSLYVKFILIS